MPLHHELTKPTQPREPTPLVVNFAFKREFDLPTLIEIVAGIHSARGLRNYGKRELHTAIKEHVITVGLSNLHAWRFGLAPDRQQTIADQALSTLACTLRSDVFPELATPVPGYRQRLDEWRNSLDHNQLSRYTRGKLKAFSEPGRRGRR